VSILQVTESRQLELSNVKPTKIPIVYLRVFHVQADSSETLKVNLPSIMEYKMQMGKRLHGLMKIALKGSAFESAIHCNCLQWAFRDPIQNQSVLLDGEDGVDIRVLPASPVCGQDEI
jgi:hypothetical protein